LPTVGVIGAGQLARMMQPAAVALGIRLVLLAESADASAAQVIPDTTVGDYTDLATLQAFAARCDVVTFDHEHVPTAHLEVLARSVQVRPGPQALVCAQDKVVMRRRLSSAGLPCPRWRSAESAADVVDFAADAGWPVIAKTPRGGYDGKGVALLADPAEAAAAFQRWGAPLLLEEAIAFTRELAAVVARSPSGQAVAYPVVETVQRDGICAEVVMPAPIADEHALAAQSIALQVAAELDVVGVLAVELFDTADGVVVNELAMRPHNSGHWSIEGAITGQFEQHLRAVCDLPLGAPDPVADTAVMVNVLGGCADIAAQYRSVMAHDPGARIHWYGKEPRPGRKVGHVTVLGADREVCAERARYVASRLAGAADG
jgi:5-(carboxyamino)imidazole ribonucleotide synthase